MTVSDAELKSMFRKYANYEILKNYMTESRKKSNTDIELLQIQYWMENAKLLNRRLTIADLSLLFMKYNKMCLNFNEFCDYLQKLCSTKAIDLGKLKAKLLEAHEPEYYEFFAIHERIYGKKHGLH